MRHTGIKRHHAKPLRKRHLGISVFGLLLLTVSMYALGFGANKIITDWRDAQPTNVVDQNSTTVISSGLGYKLTIDSNEFDATAVRFNGIEAVEVSGTQLSVGEDLLSVELHPKIGKVEPKDAATSFKIQTEELGGVLAESIASASDGSDIQKIVGDYYAPVNSGSYIYKLLSEDSEEIAGVSFNKRIYEVSADLGGNFKSAKTFAVHWSALVAQRPVNIKLSGLVGSSGIPVEYKNILDTLSFDISTSSVLNSDLSSLSSSWIGSAKVSAQPDSGLDDQTISALVSPSVVKIYSGICASLTYQGELFAKNVCTSGTGSGFILTGDGYIGTNGHVVVHEAADVFVQNILADPEFFYDLLIAGGLNNSQALAVLSDPTLVASVVSSIYEQPDGVYEMLDKKEKIYVALGSDPVEVSNYDELFNFSETSSIKEARLIDYDYAPEDVLNAQIFEEGKFTASDVAIIKIDVQNAPVLPLASSLPNQSEQIIIIGFPGDAENSLVDKGQLAITSTSGAVSAVRQASGSDLNLIQSDADASQGNSGGPAVNSKAEAIGLLTYRYKNEQAVDSSKSYIRDIADLIKLAESNNVSLDSSSSQTLEDWSKGLDLFNNSRYSKAKAEFIKVQEAYPSHRLTASYIAQADQAIAEGKDVKDFPIVIVIIGGVAGMTALGVGVWLIARHSKHHKAHLLQQGQVGPAGPPGPAVAPNQQITAQPEVTSQPSVTASQSSPVAAAPATTPAPTPVTPVQTPISTPAPVTIQPQAPAAPSSPTPAPSANPTAAIPPSYQPTVISPNKTTQ